MCLLAITLASLNISPSVARAKVLEDVAGLSRQVAAEGCVLLKNDNNTLPYDDGMKVSVFGRMQSHYYKTGTGSGGYVNAPFTVTILDGLRKNGSIKVNEDLVAVYDKWIENNPIVEGGGWAMDPHFQKEMPLTDKIVTAAAEQSDAALIVIGRTAGEEQDNSTTNGFALTVDEKNMLSKVSAKFDKVTVVLNISNVMDMKWINDYSIDAVLCVWQGGMVGGDAAADVITGDVNPSGHLPDTIAYKYSDYPSASNYGGTTIKYQEDVYVGYRYFETFAKDKVMFPFGYGLSYTTFDITTESVKAQDNKINLQVKVKNTGDRAGKEVVQVYYSAPQGKLGKPARELVAFAKTKLLEPDETQDITLSYNIEDMASYDDSGVTGHDSAYVMEKGDYNVYVGNNVRSASMEYTYSLDELKVTKQLKEQMAPTADFDRMKPVDNDGELQLDYEKVPVRQTNVMTKINASMPAEIKPTGNKGYKLSDVAKNKVTMNQFIAQLSDNELMAIVKGEGMSPSGVTGGVAGAFAGVKAEDGADLISKYGIAGACCADGPSGIRCSGEASSMPNGTCIASTWNLTLIERLFQSEGKELVFNQIDALLGPGMNIHRNPLNGRNFEYFSEDPLLTGMMASSETAGMQSAGATVTLKHFACNNQEQSRTLYDSIVSERALREIYLKPFEIAVKTSEPRAIMTSYNKINSYHSASNYEMNTEILRKEWGYTGIVMTDWWSNKNKNLGSTTSGASTKNTASMVKAQNDLDMVSITGTDLASSLSSGYLKRSELQRCAINICNYIMKSQAFARLQKISFVPYKSKITHWFDVQKLEVGNPQLAGIKVGGRVVSAFKFNTLEYKVYNSLEDDNLPEVEATAKDNEDITIKQATKASPVAKIYANEGGEQLIYRVIFSNEGNIQPVFDNPQYATLSAIKINGKNMAEFVSNTFDYAVAVDNLSTDPVIQCTAASYVHVDTNYDKSSKKAIITCTTPDQANYYVLHFGEYPKGDEFNGNKPASFWTIENENTPNWSIGNGNLSIKAERGTMKEGSNYARNVFEQSAFGNWEGVTKLRVDTSKWDNNQNAGVAVMEDDNNYIGLRLEKNGNTLRIRWVQERKGVYSEMSWVAIPDNFKNDIYFKICKKGNIYIGYYSVNGSTYTKMDRYVSAKYQNPKFALVVSNTDAVSTASTQNYDYVRFKTDIPLANPVSINGTTKLKVAELEPVDISNVIRPEGCADSDGGKNFGYCDAGEYAVYNINVLNDRTYDLLARVASKESNTAQMEMVIYIDDEILTNYIINGTGGYQSWITTPAKKVHLTKGVHKLKIYFVTSGINLNWIKFSTGEENKKVVPKVAKTKVKTATKKLSSKKIKIKLKKVKGVKKYLIQISKSKKFKKKDILVKKTVKKVSFTLKSKKLKKKKKLWVRAKACKVVNKKSYYSKWSAKKKVKIKK